MNAGFIKKKFGQYKLSQLAAGDRFYFAGDRAKNVFTLYSVMPFEQKLQRGYWKFYANCLPDGSKFPEKHFADRRVIFLRNQNEKQ